MERGHNEIIAGVAAAREFAGLDVGKTIKLGKTEWNVVGLFPPAAARAPIGSGTDTTVLQEAYGRGDSYQSVCGTRNAGKVPAI
ncbi:MAG: hypothetical protein U1F83_10920 [Verrucomicrobiota bacterium]